MHLESDIVEILITFTWINFLQILIKVFLGQRGYNFVFIIKIKDFNFLFRKNE